MTGRSFSTLSHEELAALLPELLLCGHLIDRSGMAHSLGAFGREGMTRVAIEEWQLASPVYTRRMQRTLGFPGDSVETIFKGLQFDIGAPPQFMDFRFRVDDHDNGEFWLDHCGALMDVEPMGEQFVVSMCHDIEDPTFDATALATNPHAQVRPIHRPPRSPADRHPHCAWTVRIDPAHIPPAVPPGAEAIANCEAAGVELAEIDRSEPGRADYSGPLLSDIRFADFSRSALIRLANEVCLQHHLLTLSFMRAVRSRTDEEQAAEIGRRQFTGIAGLTAARLCKALRLDGGLDAVRTVLEVHPALNPAEYVDVEFPSAETLRVRIGRAGGAFRDGAWPAMLDADHLKPLQALVGGVDPNLGVELVDADADALTVQVVELDSPVPESDEVAITRFSTGADFAFADRGTPLPLTVVAH